MIASKPGNTPSRPLCPPLPALASRRAALVAAAVVLLTGLTAGASSAATPLPSAPLTPAYSYWRLPENFSEHGQAIDTLYYTIFWLTMTIFVAVWVVMATFLVKYRHRPDRKKGLFTHGNTRLEMVWTLIPAVILIVLALWTKHSWDAYRYGDATKAQDPVRIMVVGQQFKWNVVYPGPDKKLGRYLVFPKTTDLQWPPDPGYTDFPKDAEGKPIPGPAFMPEDEARKAINAYIDQRNPLGKDFTDPNGKDDDWQGALGRQVIIPKGRPIEITLSSKDVIHDFFLPNFRVKLDAVPGMRGLIYFTATKSSAEIESKTRRQFTLDELRAALAVPGAAEYTLMIPADDPKAEEEGGSRRYWREVEKKVGRTTRKVKETVARDKDFVTPDLLDGLRAIGIERVTAYQPKVWDLVCEELCGQGHYTMKGQLVVLEQDEYRKQFETAPEAAAASTSGDPAPTGTAGLTAAVGASAAPSKP